MVDRITKSTDSRIYRSKVDGSLERIKTNIKDYYEWFLPNYKRFNQFMRFVFETSLSQEDIALMKELQKPQIEFNILEAYVSRQRGEFAKQEPSITVHPADILKNPIDPQLLNVIEDHFRAIIDDSNRDNMAYDTFTDQCGGGFSSWKIYTAYANEYSFDQNIRWRRTYDPTLTGFDKLARLSHKGDGQYCFEIIPKSREAFEKEYGEDGKKYTKDMKFVRRNVKFSRAIEDFSWSYTTSKGEEILLVGEYFEKRIEKQKIIQLLDGSVIPEKDYEAFVEDWNKQGMIAQPPVPVKARMSDVVNIDRYIITENNVIQYDQTDYRFLPIIFVDGNSMWIRETNGNAARQVTRPMVYHAEGIQKLKNFAGITLANELENMVQHKWKVQKEAIPEEYRDAYTDVQVPNVLVYNGFKDNDPNVPLAPPQEVVRVGAPPELMNTFSVSDEMTQSILGNYDAAQGIQGNQISGEAIKVGAMQTNATSMPYVISYIKALNRACEITLDLMPKYYNLPRSIPTKSINGKRTYAIINQDGAPKMEYSDDALEVKVEAGVNFEIQRSQSLNTLQRLMQTSPVLNELIGTTESGVMMILDNVDIRGIDGLKQEVPQFIQKKNEQMQQQQQMQQKQQMMEMQQMQQFNPVQSEMAKIQQRREESFMKASEDEKDRNVDMYKAETERLNVLSKISKDNVELDMKQAEMIENKANQDLVSLNDIFGGMVE